MIMVKLNAFIFTEIKWIVIRLKPLETQPFESCTCSTIYTTAKTPTPTHQHTHTFLNSMVLQHINKYYKVLVIVA